jgi:ceramide glucosyltransferase
MELIDIGAVTVAGLATIDRIWRAGLIARFRRRTTPTVRHEGPLPLVTILQPVVSGDERLEAVMRATLQAKNAHRVEVLWLAETDDVEAAAITARLVAGLDGSGAVTARLVPVPKPGPHDSPKMNAMCAGFAVATGDVIISLDDDTCLKDGDVDAAVAALDGPDVGLSFFMPCYVSHGTWWSSLLSVFVNASGIPTYVASEAVGATTMPGVFWAMKRSVLEGLGGFERFRHMIVDHEGQQAAVRAAGLRMVPLPRTHDTETSLSSARDYVTIMQRWFTYARDGYFRTHGARVIAATVVIGMVPTMLPLVALLLLALQPDVVTAAAVAVTFLGHWLTFKWLDATWLGGRCPPGRSLLVPVSTVLLPLHIIAALVLPPRLRWRGQLIELDGRGGFRILEARRRPATIGA